MFYLFKYIDFLIFYFQNIYNFRFVQLIIYLYDLFNLKTKIKKKKILIK